MGPWQGQQLQRLRNAPKIIPKNTFSAKTQSTLNLWLETSLKSLRLCLKPLITTITQSYWKHGITSIDSTKKKTKIWLLCCDREPESTTWSARKVFLSCHLAWDFYRLQRSSVGNASLISSKSAAMTKGHHHRWLRDFAWHVKTTGSVDMPKSYLPTGTWKSTEVLLFKR